LKISKIGPWGGGDWLRDDFQIVEIHPPSFRIFLISGDRVLGEVPNFKLWSKNKGS
jgi:hypothetical protein